MPAYQACHVVEEEAHEEFSAGLGIRVDDEMKIVELADGQCKRSGVKMGMIIYGIDSVPLEDLTKEPMTAESFGEYIKERPKPYTLNFNALKAPPTEEEDLLGRILIGLGIVKKHRAPKTPGNVSGQRVLYADPIKEGEALKTLKVGKEKGHATKEVEVADVANVGVSKKNDNHIVIQHAKDKKKNLTLDMGSKQAAAGHARVLHRLCSQEQEKLGNPPVINTVSTPASP